MTDKEIINKITCYIHAKKVYEKLERELIKVLKEKASQNGGYDINELLCG